MDRAEEIADVAKDEDLNEEEEEETQKIAYDDVADFQDSEEDVGQQEGEETDEYENEEYEADDFEAENEGLEEEQKNESAPVEAAGVDDNSEAPTKAEVEGEKEELSAAPGEDATAQASAPTQSFETQIEMAESSQAAEADAEGQQQEDHSIATSPMQFDDDDGTEEEEEDAEGKAMTDMTFKPPVEVMETLASAKKEEKIQEPVAAEAEEDQKVEAEPERAAAPPQARMADAPPARPEAKEEVVVAVTSNPIATLAAAEDGPKPIPANENVEALEQYKQYEQYQAGLELERQLEKLDIQRKASMENVSRDLFNASAANAVASRPVGHFQQSSQAEASQDLAANVNTSYVSVPTVERVPVPQQEWARPPIKETCDDMVPRHQLGGMTLETDLDKDLRNRLRMTDLERMHQDKQVLAEMHHNSRSRDVSANKVGGTRKYLESTVVPVLREAMKDLARKRPDDPFDFLIEYLQRNKPPTRR